MSFNRRLAIVSVMLAMAISSFTAIIPTAHAADPAESITMSPASKNYTLTAGETLSDSFTILNDGQTAYDFTVYATPYSVTSPLYDQNFSVTKPNADAYTWVQFEKTTYHAEPRQTLVIPYTIHVKPDAAPGGHYGAIFAEVQPGSDSGQLARKKRIGCIIYATVGGDVHLSGKVASISTPGFQTSAPLMATTLVENSGNTDFPATVAYQVSDLFGSTKYTVQNTYEVLPSTTRQIDMQWNGVAWFGFYKVHTAVTVLGQTTVHDAYVLMMPIWLILLLALAVLFGGIYAFSRKQHRSKR